MNKFIKSLTQTCKDFHRNPALYFDRSFSGGTGKQIGWLLIVFGFVLIILYAIYCILPGEGSLGERFSIVLFQLISPGDSDVMPVLFAVIVDVLGLVIFGGMLISVASNILERRIEAYQNGETFYKLRDHFVIIGYNNSVPSLIKTLRTKNGTQDEETFILIQSGQDANEVRRLMEIGANAWMTKNTIIIHGMGNSEEDIQKLNITACKAVYIIGDSTTEAHDSTNLDSLTLVSKLWREAHPESFPNEPTNLVHKLHCNVLFEHQTLYSIFQFSELQKIVSGAVHFHPFNLHENWAKKVLVVGAADEKSAYKPLEGEKGLRKDSDKHVHMIIIGMSRMGTAMAVETAQTAHYPNFKEDDNTTRTHITFIDCNAMEEMNAFKSRFPNVFDMMRWRYIDTNKSDALYSLSDDSWVNPIEQASSPYSHLGPNFTDLQWEFINGHVESPSVRKYLTDAVNDKSAITTIAVCLPEAQQAMQVALYLPDYVLRNAHQIHIYQEENDAIARSVNNPNDPCTRYDNLISFGSVSDTYSNDFIGDREGMWINAYYAKEYAAPELRESYQQAWKNKDDSWAERLWDGISVSDKWSSIHSANMIHTKLRCIGCTTDDDIETIKKAIVENMHDLIFTEHNRWLTEQLLAGFRPLFADEWKEYVRTKKPKKKAEKAHGNICSNNRLVEVEPDSHEKDIQVTFALLEIIEHKKKVKTQE